MSLRSRDVGRLLALADGRLGERARARLEARLKAEPELAEAWERLRATRKLVRELDQVELPEEPPYRQIEAQVRWRVAQQEDRDAARRARLRPWRWALALTTACLLGGVGGVFLQRMLLSTATPPTLVRKTPTPPPTRPKATRPAPQPRRGQKAGDEHELAALAVVTSGEVSVAPAGGALSRLALNRPLLPGDRVLTAANGLVTLQWEDGTGAQLESDGELKLQQLTDRHQTLVLDAGRARFVVAPHRPRSFDVIAGNLRVHVVGTRFAVSVGRDATEVEVTEGKVQTFPYDPKRPLAPGKGLAVAAGQRLRVARSGGAPQLSTLAVTQARQGPTKKPSLLYLAVWSNLARVLATTSLLRVESQPGGADLRFDHHPVGRTNLRFRGSHGRHLLELWRDGKLLRRHWVQLRPDKPTRVALQLDNVQVRRTARLPAGIYQLFRRRAVLIQRCYERRLKQRPGLAGRFELRVGFDAAGKVTEASIDRDTLDDPNVGRCAMAVVKRWRFPPGQPAALVYPFVFRKH